MRGRLNAGTRFADRVVICLDVRGVWNGQCGSFGLIDADV